MSADLFVFQTREERVRAFNPHISDMALQRHLEQEDRLREIAAQQRRQLVERAYQDFAEAQRALKDTGAPRS